MAITSYKYFIFLAVVAIIYYLLKQKYRQIFLVSASLIFYFINQQTAILYLLASIFINYAINRALAKTKRKSLLAVSVTMNIALLAFFKYLPPIFNTQSGFWENVILPIGISFYTFQAIGYTLDIYWKRKTEIVSLPSYMLYMTFFPQLLSGPIARAERFFPQLKKEQIFRYENAVGGLRLILWGLFKKLVIANNASPYVNAIFDNLQFHSSISILFASVLYVIQLYCDFSGYSDIAIGSGKIFGIELLRNFQTPFFAKSVTEFWRCWHISLSNWVRDYVNTPLQFAFRNSKTGIFIALYVTFLIIGVWHGPKVNFLIFGLLQGSLIIFEYFTQKQRRAFWVIFPQWLSNALSILLTFCIFVVGGILLRSNTFSDALYVYSHLGLSKNLYHSPTLIASVFIGALVVFISELKMANQDFSQYIGRQNTQVRWLYYLGCSIFILMQGGLDGDSFIYFQF